MKTLKKIILTTLCACCALFAGAASISLRKDVKTASAAVATEYTTVDAPMMMKLESVYISGGNFNICVTLPQYDTEEVMEVVPLGDVDLATVFDGFGFFDSVKIGEKTLRELGCTQFYENRMSVNVGEPKSIVRLFLHAEPAVWEAACNNGEVQFGEAQTPVTASEGTIIPGYNYLQGNADAVVYRADMDYVTKRVTPLTYSYYTAGQTEIDSVRYVQGHDGNCGYLGVSLIGDDYATNGTQEEFIDNYKHAFLTNSLLADGFLQTVLVNGEAGKIEGYSLLNLGNAGKGYFSFVIRVHQDDVKTVTIPKGSYFPAYVMRSLFMKNGHLVYMGYQTTEDVTFYKNANGDFVTFAQYTEDRKAELNAYRAEKTSVDYFEADLAAMDETVYTAISVFDDATTLEEIDEAFVIAKTFMDSIELKATVIESAKVELNAYKAGEFREAEEAQRISLIEASYSQIEGAVSKIGVAMIVSRVKGDIDTLKTAAQYADEELAGEKAAANTAINDYLADVEYLAEQQAERDAAVEAGLAAVVAAKSSEEITQAVVDAKAAMDDITAKAVIIDAAKAEVEAYKADRVYRETEANARAAAIATAMAALDNATTQAEVDEIVATAKSTIDVLKTDIELTEEERAEADALYGEDKAIALAKINELKASVNYDDYSTENQAVINELYRLAKLAVADALTEETIAQAAVDFETELAKVAKIEQGNTPNDSVTPDTDASDSQQQQATGSFFGLLMGGCQSSVGIASALVMIALGGVALVAKKKED